MERLGLEWLLTRLDLRWQISEAKFLVLELMANQEPLTSAEIVMRTFAVRDQVECCHLCAELGKVLGMVYRNEYHNRSPRLSDLSPFDMLGNVCIGDCSYLVVSAPFWRCWNGRSGPGNMTGSEAY